MKIIRQLTLLSAMAVASIFSTVKADVDPNFYVYLCIGQSNMEGQGTIEAQDLTGISDRFLMMSAIDCDDRVAGEWRKALPPLCRCGTKLSPADYFGRAMTEALPDEVRVGVINVAVAGCKIDLFDKTDYKSYIQNEVTQQWQKDMVNAYDGNPREKLIAAAQKAQEEGVIKGILLHQGESDAYSDQWLQKVKKVYGDLLSDLGLSTLEVPLIAGEVVQTSMGGSCGGANTTINRLPTVIPQSYVVSSANLGHQGDNLHFSSASYRELGRRYAAKALELLGIEQNPDDDTPSNTTKVHADFSNPTLSGEVQWDATTQTMTWTQKWANQIRNLHLPTGDLTGYEKIGVESADLNGQNFRLLVYNGSDATTISVTQTGVQEFRLADYVSSANLKNVTEVVLSGGNGEEHGSVRILDLWLETFDLSIPAKKDPELAFTPAIVTLYEGDAFTAPVLSNPNHLPVTYAITATPADLATIDSATGEVVLDEGRGRAVVTATFAGNDEFKEGSASYSIIVRAKDASERPLVYDVEDTGADFAEPAYPSRSELPFIEQLTDPFLYSDGSGRALDFQDWALRRSEISHELQHYELGRKPVVTPDQVQASMSGNTLTVKVTVGGKSITLTSSILYPSGGTAPFPIVIGMGGNGGSLGTGLFNGVGSIAHMAFNFTQVATDSQNGGDGSGPFDTLYPELAENGTEIKWAWGVSRLIDGLVQLGPEVTRIDTEHIAVTGCSFAGKMALYCGAFDERVALTIPQEPGGGGVASWRVSQWLPINVEKISNTNYTWFLSSLRDSFNGDNVSYLPYDHHELAAMICPRALIMVGNPSMTWLADPSGFISMQAARKVWQQYGIEERCGYTFVGHGDHCGLPQSQYPELQAFIRRYLLGQEDVDTNVEIAPDNYWNSYDIERWTQWWGTDQQPPIYLPTADEGEASIWIEAEDMRSSDNGQNLRVVSDATCSGGQYVETVQNATTLSQDHANWLMADFTVEQEGDYTLFARINTNGSFDDDSYYMAFDDDTPSLANGMADAGNVWSWVSMSNYLGQMRKHLEPGQHSLTIVSREDGAKLDVLKISTSRMLPDPGVLKPETDGIKQVHSSKFIVQSVYDLQGRPLSRPAKGVYVVDGKKRLNK